MSWINWAFVTVVIFGVILFLYGSNYYDVVVGSAGVFLLAIGVVGILVLYIFKQITKKEI